ncbi:MAG: adenylate cyclase [Elusimicrobia bacterium]|nr:MAG: adenylate cyclase [Elusimicrobiota bacterium]
MPRNVEIKAAVRDRTALVSRARRLWGAPRRLQQRDLFFPCPNGRLKLRLQNPGPSYLIAYIRPDRKGPKTSRYVTAVAPEPEALAACLRAALGTGPVVKKTRLLFKSGRTRVHVDSVVGLGDFLELEVVLRRGEGAAAGRREALRLMGRLGVRPGDLLEGAYADLARATRVPATRSCQPRPSFSQKAQT